MRRFQAKAHQNPEIQSLALAPCCGLRRSPGDGSEDALCSECHATVGVYPLALGTDPCLVRLLGALVVWLPPALVQRILLLASANLP